MGDVLFLSHPVESASPVFLQRTGQLLAVVNYLKGQSRNEATISCQHSYRSWVGPTVFRGPQNFEPSRGICLLPRNFNISTEFPGIWEFEKWPVISRIVGVTSDIVITLISLISHLDFLTSEHFGSSVKTFRFRMTNGHFKHQSSVTHFSHLAFNNCSVWTALLVFSHKWEAVASRGIWMLLLQWAADFR